MLLLTESTLFFLNHTSSINATTHKLAPGGQVTNWVSGVKPDEIGDLLEYEATCAGKKQDKGKPREPTAPFMQAPNRKSSKRKANEILVLDEVPAQKKAKIEPSAAPVRSVPAKLKRQQNVPVDTTLEHMKACDAYRTVDLPAAMQADQRWTKKYLPTILLWAGSYEDIWVIPDDVLLHHAQLIFDAVYKDLHIVLVHNGVVHSLTARRISEWRSNFGSTAIAIIMDFMTCTSDCAPSDLAASLVHNWVFVYEDPDSPSPLTAYRSPFILQLLGRAHFNAIKGYVKVPAFDMHELVTSGMPRVLALSTVAIEHALVLFKNKQLKVQDILSSASRSKVAIKLPKIVNKLTEKKTNTPFSFSATLWSKPTKGFIKSILNKPAGYVEATIEMARTANGATDMPSSDDEEWYEDERAMIGYRFCGHSHSICGSLHNAT